MSGADTGGRVSQNYLRQFRDARSLELRRLSAVQFMSVWEHYDTDGQFRCHYFYSSSSSTRRLVLGNGFIEGEELDAFLREFIASVNSDENLQVGFPCWLNKKYINM